jgi:alkylated DNA repair dioxygenase AlkB
MTAAQLDLLDTPKNLPEGFAYEPEVITPEEEQALVLRFRDLELKEFEFQGYRGKRRVISFGLHYDFNEGSLKQTSPMPDFLLPARERAARFASIPSADLAHALITEYSPGAPIGWHRDRPVFGDVIGLSFLSSCKFRFRRKAGSRWERAAQILEPRSAYLLRGPARTIWEHSIPEAESLRYSVTFRTIRSDR